MNSIEVKSYLDSFINHELNLTNINYATFKLRRAQRLMEILGDPQRSLRCLHVAGSKGKGSTCAFASSILKAAGYRVGFYSSPHLDTVNERIRVLSPQGQPSTPQRPFPESISDADMADTLEGMKPVLETMRSTAEYGRLSYFEVLTALAFVYFQQQQVDWVVLETGLGGRLDATNVADSLVSAITPISLEHTRLLGSTLESIAKEKAGIIKSAKQKVILAVQSAAARQVLEGHCRVVRSEFISVGREILVEPGEISGVKQRFKVKGTQQTYDLETSLLGEHQMINAATAIGMMEALENFSVDIKREAIEKGIAQAAWPGRFEIMRRRPWVILDGAHNPDSARTLVQTISRIFSDRKVFFILGVSTDKDVVGICAELKPAAKEVILTRADHPRAYAFSDEDRGLNFLGVPAYRMDSTAQALEFAAARVKRDDVVVVTGSLFVVAEARKILVQ